MATNPYESPAHPSGIEPADSHVRFTVLAFLCALSFVLYIDRVCIGKAGVAIQNELGLTQSQWGWVLGAFTIAYGLFEVPTGRWGDRYGSRGVLTRIVLWWSAFTALTGAATGFGMLVAVRFLFGAGEAGAYPNTARVLARWFPSSERATAQGIVVTSAQVGGALAPAVAAYLIFYLGWRWSFVAFGSLGLVWAAAFYYWFRDDPAEHPAISPSERALIATAAQAPGADAHPAIPWKSVLSSSNVWLMGGVQTCASFVSYMLMGWYPTYLEKARGVESIEAGWLSSLVLAGGAIGSLAGGFINAWLFRVTGSRKWCHRSYGAAALALAGGCLLTSIFCDSPLVASLWAAASFLLASSHQAAWWEVVTQISGRHLGALFGLMNSMGVPGAFASTVLLGKFADWMGSRGYEGRDQWDPAFYVYALVLLAGAGCWILVDATKSAVDEPLRGNE